MKFKPSGSGKYDLWIIDHGSHECHDFGILPANTIKQLESDVPIRLNVGNKYFGQVHIERKHGHWVKKHNLTVPELVYYKLGQPGKIFCTEKDSKIKLSLSIQPSALLVLELIELNSNDPHLSITTLYELNSYLDGRPIGRYKGRG